MERVGVLINKLAELHAQGADARTLQVTLQMLQAELHQYVNHQTSNKATISVTVPNFKPMEVVAQPKLEAIVTSPTAFETVALPTLEPSLQPNFIDAKPKHHHPKKDEVSGWLFDPIKDVPTLAHQDKKVFELNDVVGGTLNSLNDKLKVEKTEVAAILQDLPVRDLRKAISINERHRFINELFRDDETMYERSIKTINSFNIYPEAEYWIQRELKIKLGWDESREIVKQFDLTVKRRFS
jgi:hypothetical protein